MGSRQQTSDWSYLKIIESFGLEKIFKDFKSNRQLDLLSAITKPRPSVPRSHTPLVQGASRCISAIFSCLRRVKQLKWGKMRPMLGARVGCREHSTQSRALIFHSPSTPPLRAKTSSSLFWCSQINHAYAVCELVSTRHMHPDFTVTCSTAHLPTLGPYSLFTHSAAFLKLQPHYFLSPPLFLSYLSGIFSCHSNCSQDWLLSCYIYGRTP